MKKIFVFLVLSLIFAFSDTVFAQKAQVLAQAKKVVAALKNKDMRRLSDFVHPTKGVRFSPYGNLSDEDLTFKKSQIPTLFLVRRTFVWGNYDGSGEPINLGFPQYFDRFVYDQDFARAPRVAYDRIIRQGNTAINIKETFPSARFVEYHFPGTRKNNNLDWRSLRLIFEKSGGRWYLVGISHDRWTI